MMIRALLRKQLRELGAAFLRSSKTGKARSRASAVGYALLFAVLVVVLMLCFAGMALPLASVLLPAGLDWLYFASMGLTALLVSVLASAFTSYSGLFQSRDNELLLSLPIPPAVIFGVRVSTVYLACLIYLLMAWVPAVVCYGLLAAHPLAGVLCSIPMALVLAGAACILAVLLGWAVALANDRARHKSLVTVVCSLVFFALYYAGFLRVQEMLDDLLASAAQSGAALARAAWPLRLLGGAAAGELPALVGLVLGTVLCFAAFCKLLEKPYLRRHDGPEGYGPHGIPCAKSTPRQPAAGSAAPGTAASGVQLGLYAQQRHGHAGPAGAGRRVPVEGRPLCPVCAGRAGRDPGAGVLCRVCGVVSQLPDHALRLAGRSDGLAFAKPAHSVLAGPVC